MEPKDVGKLQNNNSFPIQNPGWTGKSEICLKWGLSCSGYQMESKTVLTTLAGTLQVLDVIIDKAPSQTLYKADKGVRTETGEVSVDIFTTLLSSKWDPWRQRRLT